MKKKLLFVVVPIIIVLVALIVLWNPLISPSIQYNKAIDLAEDGYHSDAIEILEKLDGFKDSEEKIHEFKKEKRDLDEWARAQMLEEWNNYFS